MHKIAVCIAALISIVPAISWGQASVPSLTGDQPRAAYTSEKEMENVIVGGFTVGGNYDDNAFNSASSKVGASQFVFAGNIGFQQTHRRWAWTMQYSPGLTLSQRFAERTQATHAFGGTFKLNLSPRTRIRLRQDYTRTNNPFATTTAGGLLPDRGPIVTPNPSIVLPHTNRTSGISSADIAYRTGPHGTFGVSGSFAFQDYGQQILSSNPNLLLSTKTVTGSAYYFQQTSARTSVGVQYAFMDLYNDNSGNAGRTQTNSVLLLMRRKFGSSAEVTLYAGPERSASHGKYNLVFGPFVIALPYESDKWAPAAGGGFSFATSRNIFRLQGVRRVSDGGGLMAAAESAYGSFSWNRRWSRNWSSYLDVSAGQNTALARSNAKYQLSSGSAGAGLEREIGKNIYARFGYAWLRQTGNFYQYALGNHNRFEFSLGYRFMKPIGR